MRKIKYQNWIYEVINETSPRPSPTGEGDFSPPLVGEGDGSINSPQRGGVSAVDPEIEKQVRKALARLSEKEKIFIEEFYYQGRSYKEISAILKINLKQAEYLHRRATFKLRNLLAGFVERKFKIKVDRVSPEKSVKHRKSVFACIICQNPKQKEIEKVINSKKEQETWRVVLKKLKSEFNLDIKAPQILIGHMKHRS